MNTPDLAGRILITLFAILILVINPAHAQNLETFEERVTEFTLNNGMHFIVVERDVAPVASFVTFVDVGSVNEPVNNTGIAHIFEHMVFKGSRDIGTTNWEEEQKYIDAMDEAYQAWLREKYMPEPNEERLDQLWAEFEANQDSASRFVVTNEFDEIVSTQGANGLNAFTSSDATGYFYSLPQNRAELWFNLEADRFKNPVFREFFEEKEVIMEERRMRTDSDPVGRLIEEFLSVAFSAHAYRNPVIGWPSDIEATTVADLEDFYDDWYKPSSFTISIVGDVDPDRMRELAEAYFGDIPAGGDTPLVKTVEPEQRGERRFVIEDNSQPYFLAGYHTVGQMHDDWAALQLLGSIIAEGRTSRLYRRMVQDEELALAIQAFNGYPGTKYPSMFITFAVPNQGVSLDVIESVIDEEILKIKEGDIRQDELTRAVTNARATLVRSLDSNLGLALSLAENHAQQGDWRRLFTYMEDLQAVTLDDLQRVANQYLIPMRRTVGMIVNRQAVDTATTENSN